MGYRLYPELAEPLQEAALLGLSRLGFFEHVAFYGGTALRILHGLDRYSEDLDFSLGCLLTGGAQDVLTWIGKGAREPWLFSAN